MSWLCTVSLHGIKYCDPGSIKNLSYKIILIYCFIAVDTTCIMKCGYGCRCEWVLARVFRSVSVALITTENLQNA
jgi:hypothetical protein